MTRRKPALAPNLFPFLAVLVCTLGTLILLLALVAQDARQSAAEETAAHVKSAQIAADDLQWQAEQLHELRQSQAKDVDRKRAELAHLEDHLRRLRQDLTQLQLELEAANNSDDPRTATDAQKRLAELGDQLAAEQAKLDDLREEKKKRPPRVVIVPYQGTNGTDRRPIYVECTDAAVIIQPEGIRITAEHLDGPLGPGNPLDAALRTIRSHWRSLDPDAPPPYPLLLVRPGGIYAYGACRTAMASWDDQFGYELVPDEVPLAFPKPDPDLANKLAAAIDDAVQRQRGRLAAGSGNGGQSGFAPRSSSYQYGGSGSGDLASPTPTGSGARGARNSNVAGPTNGNGETTLSGGATVSSGKNTNGGSAQGTTPGSAKPANPATNNLAANNPDAGNGSIGLANPGTGGDSSDADGTPNDEGSAFAGGDSSTASSSTASSSTASSGSANTGADNGSSSNPMQSAANNAAAADALRASNLDLSSEPFDPHAKTFSEAVNEQSANSRAKPPTNSPPPILRAGNNWALPESSLQIRGANIVRQMRLRCEPGQFVLLPENKPGSVLRQFPVENGDVEGAVMQLASSLRERIAGWGVAMQNGRWDPVLVVQVAPGAEGRFRQLQAILRDSGIRVEQETAP